MAVQVAGRLLDLWWHSTHDEFETGLDQLEAHWLIWLGVLGTLAVAVAALIRGNRGPQRLGFLAVVAAAVAYIGVAIWHFIEHARGNDPDVAHVLIAITWIAGLLAVLLTTLLARRRLNQHLTSS